MKHDTLAGRRSLVTGATAGIGQAIAQALHDHGAEVIIHGIEPEAGERLATELNGIYIDADLSEPNGIAALVRRVIDLGPLDILVNNAGIEQSSAIETVDEGVLWETMKINFIAPTILLRELLPSLRAAPAGSVINITSIHQDVPVAGNLAYCASKAALAMLTRTAALEFGRAGVRVNSIAPGAIETRHNTDLIQQVGRHRFESWIPLGRVGTPDEVADIAVFLAGDAARYINGTTIIADGGYREHLVRYE